MSAARGGLSSGYRWLWCRVRIGMAVGVLSIAALFTTATPLPARDVNHIYHRGLINVTDAPTLLGLEPILPRGSLLDTKIAPGRRRASLPALTIAPDSRAASGPVSKGATESQQGRALSRGIDALERRLEGRRLRNVDIYFQPRYGAHKEMLDVDVLVALLDEPDSAIFSQVGGQLYDGKGGFHVGTGYRYLAGNNRDLLFGINAFYDALLDPGVSRWSLGVEHKNRLLDLYANWYQGMGDDGPLYSPDGWDVEFAGQLPMLPWLELAGRYYSWDLREAGELTGQEYTVSLRPLSLIGVQLYYDHPDSGIPAAWGLGLNVEYRFGLSMRDQLRTLDSQARAPVHRRFKRVRREYEQQVQDAAAALPAAGGGSSRLVIDVENSLVSGGALGRSLPRQDGNLAVALVLDAPTVPDAGTVAVRFAGTARFGLDYQVSNLIAGSTPILTAERFDISRFTRSISFLVNISPGVRLCRGCDIAIQVDNAGPVRLLTISAGP